MNIPKDLLYSTDHEWLREENGFAFIGITDFAQSSLGDIVFIELPEVGVKLKKGDSFGVVESIKSANDLFTPTSGEVVRINEKLEENPELCNSDPYGSWIIKIKLEEKTADLLSPSLYEEHCKEKCE